MKKIILMLAVVTGGFDPLMAEDLGGIRASAGSALSLDVAGIVKDAGVLPEPVAKPVESGAAGPAAGVFAGKSNWTGGDGYSSLEQLGVRKSAEEDAVAKCTAQGLAGCVAVGSVIESCDSYRCIGSGLAFALVPAAGAAVFSAEKEWTGGDGFSPLEQLGVRKSAEDKAVAKCQAQGLMGCVAIGSSIGTCNSYRCNATGMAQARTRPQ